MQQPDEVGHIIIIILKMRKLRNREHKRVTWQQSAWWAQRYIYSSFLLGRMTPSGTHGKYLELIELGYSLLVEWVDQMTMSSNLGLIILGLANCAFESHPGHLCMALSPLYMFLSLHTCLKWILINIIRKYIECIINCSFKNYK